VNGWHLALKSRQDNQLPFLVARKSHTNLTYI
jgi:hypothetical protein